MLEFKPPAPAPADDESLPRSGRPLFNLICFLTLGTLVCAWFWYYTGWFEEVGTILTLGGALSWLTVALKVFPEDRVKEFQALTYKNLLQRKWLTVAYIIILILFIGFTGIFGSIEFSPLNDSGERPVVVCPSSEAGEGSAADYWKRAVADDDFEVLSPGKDLRILVPVWWGLRRKFLVKVGGYPDKAITLRPWTRRELIVPSSFRRPVVLLRPSETLVDETNPTPWKLRVTVGKITVEDDHFDGHAVWIGCDADVEIPRSTLALWGELPDPVVREHLLLPRALNLPIRELTAGDEIRVEIISPEPKQYNPFPKPRRVEKIPDRPEFAPQVLSLDVIELH